MGGSVAAQDPNIVILGYGVTDSLQLTLESQRVLTRVGKAYALHLPPNLRRYLATQRVNCVDLSGSLNGSRPLSEGYLDVADAILRRTAEERPVVVLTPGSPHFLNVVTRFLTAQARERGLSVTAYPAVSQVDAIVSYLGLDVGANGLQLFDAGRLAASRERLNPGIPLLLLSAVGVGAAGIAGLAAHLRAHYPGDHAVTLLNVGLRTRGRHVTVRLDDCESLGARITPESAIFVDRLPAAGAIPPAVQAARKEV